MEINKLAFSGGAIKGIAYVGVFKKIEELIYERRLEESRVDFDAVKCNIPYFNIKTICAVSVGSIFSLIYLLKFTYAEMLEEVLHKKFDQLKDIRIMNFVSKYGLDSGVNLISWMQSLMIKKSVNPSITLKEFYDLNGVDFQIMATNLNKYCYKKFNYLETPDVKVLDAVRMSISVPFLFTINEFEGDIHVDGGLIDNYPIKVFEDDLTHFLGFKLINHGEMDSHDVDERIDDIESYIYHILSCYMVQKEKHTTRTEEFRNCTVYIHTEDITQSVNFSLTAAEKNKLIEIGYKSINNFFNSKNNTS
jgi:NTE family protein